MAGTRPRVTAFLLRDPLIFSVPEARILGNLYVAGRPNLGVCLSVVTVVQGVCRQAYEVDFTDSQVHLPAPKSFSGYTLENGVSFDNFNPSHIAFQSLMRWETPDGRVGHTELANIFGREFLAARISRSARG